MVELPWFKFTQKGFFLEILAAPSAPQSILSFISILYSKFDHIRQVLSKFRRFRKNHRIYRFSENILKFGPQNTHKSLFIELFAHFFSKNGRITKTSVKVGKRSSPFLAITLSRSLLTIIVTSNLFCNILLHKLT